jgi:hypothetical protein
MHYFEKQILRKKNLPEVAPSAEFKVPNSAFSVFAQIVLDQKFTNDKPLRVDMFGTGKRVRCYRCYMSVTVRADSFGKAHGKRVRIDAIDVGLKVLYLKEIITPNGPWKNLNRCANKSAKKFTKKNDAKKCQNFS